MATTDPAERFRSTGRNDDCPCGSGKKYKKCHLREDEAALSKAMAETQAKADAAAAKEAKDEAEKAAARGEHPQAHTAAAGPAAPKTPLSHKPMNTPRKAV